MGRRVGRLGDCRYSFGVWTCDSIVQSTLSSSFATSVVSSPCQETGLMTLESQCDVASTRVTCNGGRKLPPAPRLRHCSMTSSTALPIAANSSKASCSLLARSICAHLRHQRVLCLNVDTSEVNPEVETRKCALQLRRRATSRSSCLHAYCCLVQCDAIRMCGFASEGVSIERKLSPILGPSEG